MQVIRDYHGITGDLKHINCWDLSKVEGLPEGGKLDLTALGLGDTSMRVRVGRNLKDFPLPGNMTQDDRVNLEKRMIVAFEKLMEDPAYGGTYHTLTPDTKYSIDQAKYQELVDAHIMFKDMSADPYLNSAGISCHWPFGRGVYVSEDKGFIVWVGEEDHLRIMCMKTGTCLNDVFDRLQTCLKVMESQEGCEFAVSPDYGYVTSCPTNLGSGMRASLHIKLPCLTKKGKDVSEAKAFAKTLGLSVRGVGGEHTEAGEDGTVDISPSARLCIKESEIVAALYKGIKLLMEKETVSALHCCGASLIGEDGAPLLFGCTCTQGISSQVSGFVHCLCSTSTVVLSNIPVSLSPTWHLTHASHPHSRLLVRVVTPAAMAAPLSSRPSLISRCPILTTAWPSTSAMTTTSPSLLTSRSSCCCAARAATRTLTLAWVCTP